MQNGLYVSLSAQVALERRLETIADNVANMNTVGYRGTGVSFETEMAKAGDARLGYASSGSDFISRRLGGLIKTDNTSISPSRVTAGLESKRRREWRTRAMAGRILTSRACFAR